MYHLYFQYYNSNLKHGPNMSGKIYAVLVELEKKNKLQGITIAQVTNFIAETRFSYFPIAFGSVSLRIVSTSKSSVDVMSHQFIHVA